MKINGYKDIITNLHNEMIELKKQIEEWILTIKGEDERRIRIKALNTIIGLYGDRLPEEERIEAYNHLEALMSISDYMFFSSVIYREKLQNIIKNNIESINNLIIKLKNICENGDLSNYSKVSAQKVNDDNQNSEMQNSYELLRIYENELKKISHILHDGPVQMIANLGFQLSVIKNYLEKINKPEIMIELERCNGYIQNIILEVKKCISLIRPMTLDDLGIIETLERYFKEISADCKVPIRLYIEGKRFEISNLCSFVIYRVIQEAIMNAIKHSETKYVDVTVRFESRKLDNIEKKFIIGVIRDYGNGFDIDMLAKLIYKNEYNGIRNMRHKIEILNGKFKIESKKKEGTIVSFEIPV